MQVAIKALARAGFWGNYNILIWAWEGKEAVKETFPYPFGPISINEDDKNTNKVSNTL